MNKKSIKAMLAGLLFVPVVAFSLGLVAPMNASAAPLECDKDKLTARMGSICAKSDDQKSSLFGDGSIFSNITNTALFIIGAISVIMLIYGGIRYTISGGNEKSVTAAKNTILYAVVGIIVALLAFALVNFVIANIGA